MKSKNNITRRNFLRNSAWGACAAGLGGPGGLLTGNATFARQKALSTTNPDTIMYKELGLPIGTGFTDSRRIAVDSRGAIYVAGDKAIRVFNGGAPESGRLLREIKLNRAPRCVTVADDEKIYIGMKDHVRLYNSRFKPVANWQRLGDNAFLTGIAVAKNDVFVANAGNRIVIRYDTSGNIINHIGKKDKNRNIPGFVVPSPYFDLAVGRDGLLRVANPGRHRIEAYTSDGDLEFWWGRFSNVDVEGFCGCCNPVNFAILDDESFVTCEKGLVRVKTYDADGDFVGLVAGPKQLVKHRACRICRSPRNCGSGGFDVTVDGEGRVLVLDTINNVVRIFTKVKAEQ
jgi:outer membrane protein assembly factor BamB